MGQDSEDVLGSFALSENEKGKYESVKQSFQSHFVRRKNPIYERARFNIRKQQAGESVDAFVTALHTLAER